MAIETVVGPDDLLLTEKGQLVESLWHAVDDASGNLEVVPGLVRRVLETEAWRRRVQRGRTFEHKRFIDFITEKPLAGCGWPRKKVEALIKDDPNLLEMWRLAVTPQHGGDRTIISKNDNISLDGHGTSKSYTVSRLKREFPELFEQVVSGDLSANAAAIKAGFRKKPRKCCPNCGHEWR